VNLRRCTSLRKLRASCTRAAKCGSACRVGRSTLCSTSCAATRWRAPRSVTAPRRLKVEVKFFGRHRGEALRDGVFRSVDVPEKLQLALTARCSPGNASVLKSGEVASRRALPRGFLYARRQGIGERHGHRRYLPSRSREGRPSELEGSFAAYRDPAKPSPNHQHHMAATARGWR
jgi:hypothetical protein